MNNWKLIKFLDVLEEPVRNGIYKSKEFHGIGTKIVNMGELFSNGRLYDIDMRRIYLTDKEKDKYILKNGDLIFARRSLTADGAGKCSLIYKITEDVVFESSIIRARPNLNKVDSLFLFYFFNSPYGKYLIGTILRQVAVAGITGSDLMRLEFLLPPLPEQKAIAGVLGSLDDKIDLLQRQNTTLEAMAETLFRQWFIEEAQEDWGEQAFGNIVTFHDSKRIPLSKTEREKMQSGLLYPYYGAAQIVGYVNNFIFNGDYLLFAEDGTVRTDSGTPVLQRAYGKFWVNNHTHVITANYPYNNDFLYIFLLRKNIDELITGAVQPKISQSNLRKLPIPHYPIELVKKYILLTKNIFSKIRSNQQQIRTLEKLRDTLLPKLMSGEVRVRVDG